MKLSFDYVQNQVLIAFSHKDNSFFDFCCTPSSTILYPFVGLSIMDLALVIYDSYVNSDGRITLMKLSSTGWLFVVTVF